MPTSQLSAIHGGSHSAVGRPSPAPSRTVPPRQSRAPTTKPAPANHFAANRIKPAARGGTASAGLVVGGHHCAILTIIACPRPNSATVRAAARLMKVKK